MRDSYNMLMTEEEFVSEPIEPERGSFSTELMSQGLASLPAAFTWREKRYEIVECIDHVKQSSPEGGKASGELYLRRQQFTVRLDTNQIAKIYVERNAPRGSSKTSTGQRWYMYSIHHGDSNAAG